MPFLSRLIILLIAADCVLLSCSAEKIPVEDNQQLVGVECGDSQLYQAKGLVVKVLNEDGSSLNTKELAAVTIVVREHESNLPAQLNPKGCLFVPGNTSSLAISNQTHSILLDTTDLPQPGSAIVTRSLQPDDKLAICGKFDDHLPQEMATIAKFYNPNGEDLGLIANEYAVSANITGIISEKGCFGSQEVIQEPMVFSLTKQQWSGRLEPSPEQNYYEIAMLEKFAINLAVACRDQNSIHVADQIELRYDLDSKFEVSGELGFQLQSNESEISYQAMTKFAIKGSSQQTLKLAIDSSRFAEESYRIEVTGTDQFGRELFLTKNSQCELIVDHTKPEAPLRSVGPLEPVIYSKPGASILLLSEDQSTIQSCVKPFGSTCTAPDFSESQSIRIAEPGHYQFCTFAVDQALNSSEESCSELVVIDPSIKFSSQWIQPGNPTPALQRFIPDQLAAAITISADYDVNHLLVDYLKDNMECRLEFEELSGASTPALSGRCSDADQCGSGDLVDFVPCSLQPSFRFENETLANVNGKNLVLRVRTKDPFGTTYTHSLRSYFQGIKFSQLYDGHATYGLDSLGSTIVGRTNFGLVKASQDSFEFISLRDFLLHDSNDETFVHLSRTFIDSQNRIWISTWGGSKDKLGVVHADDSIEDFSLEPDFPNGSEFDTFFEDSRGIVWVGRGPNAQVEEDEESVSYYWNNQWTHCSLPDHPTLTFIKEDPFGNVWVGNDDYSTGDISVYTPEAIANRSCERISIREKVLEFYPDLNPALFSLKANDVIYQDGKAYIISWNRIFSATLDAPKGITDFSVFVDNNCQSQPVKLPGDRGYLFSCNFQGFRNLMTIKDDNYSILDPGESGIESPTSVQLQFIDSKERLWLSMRANFTTEIVSYDLNSEKWQHRQAMSLPVQMLEDKSGTLFIAQSDGTIVSFDGTDFRTFGDHNSNLVLFNGADEELYSRSQTHIKKSADGYVYRVDQQGILNLSKTTWNYINSQRLDQRIGRIFRTAKNSKGQIAYLSEFGLSIYDGTSHWTFYGDEIQGLDLAITTRAKYHLHQFKMDSGANNEFILQLPEATSWDGSVSTTYGFSVVVGSLSGWEVYTDASLPSGSKINANSVHYINQELWLIALQDQKKSLYRCSAGQCSEEFQTDKPITIVSSLSDGILAKVDDKHYRFTAQGQAEVATELPDFLSLYAGSEGKYFGIVEHDIYVLDSKLAVLDRHTVSSNNYYFYTDSFLEDQQYLYFTYNSVLYVFSKATNQIVATKTFQTLISTQDEPVKLKLHQLPTGQLLIYGKYSGLNLVTITGAEIEVESYNTLNKFPTNGIFETFLHGPLLKVYTDEGLAIFDTLLLF